MIYKNYKEVVSAKNKTWKSEIRQLMENGTEFLVIDLKQEDFLDCKAYGQEFDYECLHQDKSVINEYPRKMPAQIGFIKRTSFREK
jgi:hypothetical protein